jgi:hypothetical protein
METLFQLLIAVGMGLFVANLFCEVEISKAERRKQIEDSRQIQRKYPPTF